MLVAVGGGLIEPGALGAVLAQRDAPLGYWQTIVALLVALATILGLWHWRLGCAEGCCTSAGSIR